MTKWLLQSFCWEKGQSYEAVLTNIAEHMNLHEGTVTWQTCVYRKIQK